MLEIIKDFYKAISIIDLIYLILTILSLINCYKKGFILSILSMAKWLLAYIITLILFPRIYFGVFTGLAMLLAMISVLTLLPSLIIIIKPFGKTS